MEKTLEILKGQCLNIAGTIIGNTIKEQTLNEELMEKIAEQTLQLAKKIFEKSKEKQFLNWQ
ncbi:MAG: hypothetical protein QXU20_03795 [Candidatus Woesearchaeota archaeon]